MQHDFEWIGVRGDDDKFGDTSVEGFGGFVGTFLDLFEGGTLSDKISDFRGELLSGEGLGTFRDILNEWEKYHFAIVDYY